MSQDRITLDQLKVTQLLLSATRNNLGVLALTEVHCRALRLEGHARDIFGDTWSYHLSGDLAGGCTGTGFLVSPKLKVLDYRVVSARLSIIKTLPVVSRDYPELPIEASCATFSCYAPTEAAGSPADLHLFYCSIDEALEDCIRGGTYPIITGDFNVNLGADLGQDVADEGEGCTGPLAEGLPLASENCALLFGLCRKFDYVVANTFFDSQPTWYHPRTHAGHVKDLVLVHRSLIPKILSMKIDHRAAVGNNDHSLVVFNPRTNLGVRRQFHSILMGTPSNKPYGRRGSSRPKAKLTKDELFRKQLRVLDVGKLKGDPTYARCLAESLADLPPGWVHTQKAIQKTILKTLPKAKKSDVPECWQDIKGQSLHRHISAVGRARNAAVADPFNLDLQERLKSRKKELKKFVQRSKKRFLKLHIDRYISGGKKQRAAAAARLQGIPVNDTSKPSISPEGFAEHFEKLFSRTSSDEKLHLERYPHLLPPKSRPRLELSGCPGEAEMREALLGLNLNKASGTDGITAEMFLEAKEVLIPRLCADFETFWPTGPDVDFNTIATVFDGWQHAEVVTLYKGKGAKADPGSYRGIFLLEIAGKILSSVIATRLTDLIDSYLSDSQCGFRRRRGTNHQIHVLRRLQSEVRKASLPTAAIFVDFEKAFDSPPRQALYECLEYAGCPPDLLALIRAIHLDPQACVRGSTAWFKVARGIRQGCVLGPMLFNLLLDFCIRIADFGHGGVELVCVNKKDLQCPRDILGRSFKLKDAAYADDLALVGTTLALLSQSLNKLQAVTSSIGLNVSAKKTEWMWLCPPSDVPMCPPVVTPSQTPIGVNPPGPPPPCCQRIFLGDRPVVHVKSFTYLGALFTESGGVREELLSRIAKAKAKLFETNYLWKSILSKQNKTRLFKQLILPVLLYACETWTLGDRDYELLEAFMNFGRLFIANRRRYVDGITLSNSDLHRLVRLPPISFFLAPRQLAFTLGSIFKPSSEMARMMTFARVLNPVKVISGTEKISHCNCTCAILGLMLDNTPRLRAMGPLSGPARFFTNAMVASAAGWIVPSSMDGTVGVGELLSKMDLNIPFAFLGEWAGSASLGRWIKVVTRELCGKAFTLKSWPDLQRQVNRERQFQCKLCDMAYTDQRGLKRHSKVHIDTSVVSNSSSMIPGPPFNKVASDPPTAVVANQPMTESPRGAPKASGIDCDCPRLQCPLCARCFSPKGFGWLLRHMDTCHKGVAWSREGMKLCNHYAKRQKFTNVRQGKLMPNQGLVVAVPAPTGPEESVSQGGSTQVQTLRAPSADGNTEGLKCSVCGAHGPTGKPWTAFKTIQNHMAKVHGLNAKTGLPSRVRRGNAMPGTTKQSGPPNGLSK